jgi:hypothetical protein
MTAAEALEHAVEHGCVANDLLARDDQAVGDRFHAAQAHAQTSLAWAAIAVELTNLRLMGEGLS